MNDITTFFVLTLSVFMYDDNTAATRNTMEAYYRQSGNQKIIEKYVDSSTSNSVRTRVGQLVFITNILKDRRIVYETTF